MERDLVTCLYVDRVHILDMINIMVSLPSLQFLTLIDMGLLHILDTILVHCILHILGTILVHCLI